MRILLPLLLLAACTVDDTDQRPPPATFDLFATPMLRGTIGTFAVRNALPNEHIVLLVTPDPGAPPTCSTNFPFNCLDIGLPALGIAEDQSDAQGSARLQVSVPRGGTGPRPFAAQAESALTNGEISNRLDLEIVDSVPSLASMPACDFDQTSAPRYRARELFGPNAPGTFFPGFSSWGLGEHLITNDADYQQFQMDNGMSLPAVNFARRDVLAVVYSVSSTCGVGIEGWEVLAHPGTRDAVLQVEVRDSSFGCPIACAAVGMTALVVEVPKTTMPETCVEFTGGCTP